VILSVPGRHLSGVLAEHWRSRQLEKRLDVQAEQLRAEQASNAAYQLANEIRHVELELERLAPVEQQAADLRVRLEELKKAQQAASGA
jgi:hypothetical protein